MDISLLMQVLLGLGVNIGTDALFDFMKNYFTTRKSDDVSEFEQQLQSFLDIHGADIEASTIITMFASKGLLRIQQSTLYAPEQITMGAGDKAQFIIGNDSTSSTDRTRIETHGNAQISGRNAAIKQNPDGSISFHVGKEDRKK